MSRLEEIMKDQEETFSDWNGDGIICFQKDEMTLNAIKQYAEECVKASLEKASENLIAEVDMFDLNGLCFKPNEEAEKSIKNPENIILL